MKKFISFLLAAAIVFSLAACGSVKEPDSAPSDKKKVSLSVLCVNTDYSQNFVRTIQKHFSDVDLQVEYHGASNNPSGYIDRMVESGNAPDIVYSGAILREDLQALARQYPTARTKSGRFRSLERMPKADC